MKILLTTLNSKFVHMNLAIRYLYEAAIEFKDEIELREFTINNDDDFIFTELVTGEHQLVCFSCYIWNIERILYLAENLKKAKPQVKILLGGPEVSYDREALLEKYPFIDAVIAGEGELAFPQLCRNFLEGRDLTDAIVEGSVEMNLVPFPYQNIPMEKDKTVYYESTRGCPYRCAYCMSSINKGIRALPVDRVKRELDFFLEAKVRQVKFIDRTFNWNDDRCCDIISYLVEKDNGITNFHVEMCGDLISQKLLGIVEKARPGQLQFEIGIQSTNQETLEAVHRTGDFQKTGSAVRKIMGFGNIHVHLDLIAGLPFEGFESFKNSFNQVYELRPDALQLGFLKLLKGTAIRENAEQVGYVFRSRAPYEVIASSAITPLEIARLKQVEAVLDLYYNKGGFQRTITEIVKMKGETPFDLYEGLAVYYYSSGHQNLSHKKEDLYRILLGYCESQGWNSHEVQELLRLDMKDKLNTEAIKNFERKGFYAL